MKYIQFFLTVNDGKWLIADAVSKMDPVRRAMDGGTLLFKGGTTVSCVSELLTGISLRVCGRNTARGAVGELRPQTGTAHCMLFENGRAKTLDDYIDDILPKLSRDTVVITGANLIDADGGAAMLAGSPGGGRFGRASGPMATEGFRVIVAAGLEKLTPGSVQASVLHARRQGIDRSYGMACGLFPISGEIVTELKAIHLLADVQADVIGRGGIHGAEGGTLFQVSGEDDAVGRIEKAVADCKRRTAVAGDAASLVECSPGAPGCGEHLSCGYRSGKIKARGC